MSDEDVELVRPTPQLVGQHFMVPLVTEVLRKHVDLVTGGQFEEEGLVVSLDVRRRGWRKVLNLGGRQRVHWADVRTIDIRELSSTSYPVWYRLTLGDGWYEQDGRRVTIPLQPHLPEIDLARQCTQVTLRAAVVLAVLGGMGVRCVCWLMELLFLVKVSKSAVDRWVRECAAALPNAEEMTKRLHQLKPITEAHLDEIFAVGQRPKPCTIVLRDEHGRIFAMRQVEERTTASVKAFLATVRSWGIVPRAFYMDGCEEYRDAVASVFPEAVIQYDLFHVIQNVIKKLWKAVVARRRALKERAGSSTTPSYSARLQELAKRIWENRYLFFKREENLSDEERETLVSLVEQDTLLERTRDFMLRLWSIFDKSETPEAARVKLLELGLQPGVKVGTAFHRAFGFLVGRFDDMIGFLRHPGVVHRNSLAETGIRFLRRLEQGHDGFRSAESLDAYVRIYQAIKYCDWTVHHFSPGIGLPNAPPAQAPSLAAPA